MEGEEIDMTGYVLPHYDRLGKTSGKGMPSSSVRKELTWLREQRLAAVLPLASTASA